MKSQLDKLAKATVFLLLSGFFLFSANPITFATQSLLTANTPVFSNTLLGSSDTQTVTLSNPGPDSLTVTLALVSGSNSSDFTILAGADSCSGDPVLAGQTCTLDVVFAPSAIGTRNASLDISDTSGTLSVSLSGVGISSLLTANTPVFSNTLLGSSDTKTVTLTNTGPDSLTVTLASVSGSNSSDFTILAGADSCSGNPVAAGLTCTLDVVFAPSAVGTRNASLDITDTSGTLSVSLTGVGIRPGILSSDKLDISDPNASFRNTSETSTVTITNTGQAPATLETITVTTLVSGDTGYSSSNGSLSLNSSPGTCVKDLVLAYNQTCTVITRWAISETESTSPHALGTLRVDYGDSLGQKYFDQFALAGTAKDAPVSKITIFGSNAEDHTADPSTDWWDGTSWSPAYASSGYGGDANGEHPWGKVAGSLHWINCGPKLDAPCSINKAVWFRIRFSLPTGWYSPGLTFTEIADNYYTGYLNPLIDGSGLPTPSGNSANELGSGAGQFKTYCTPNYGSLGLYALSGCTPINGPLFAGTNTIFMLITDAGGLAGFNYRIDLGVRSVVALSNDTAITPPDGTTKPAGAAFEISQTISDEHYYAADHGSHGYLAVPQFRANPVATSPAVVHYSVIPQGTVVNPLPGGGTETVPTGGTATGCALTGGDTGDNANGTLTATSFGTCLIIATNDGGTEFSPNVSSNVLTFEFKKATTSTVITCPTSVVYNGAKQEPCTAIRDNGDGTSTTVTSALSYGNRTHVDDTSVAVDYLYSGDSNHLSSSAPQKTFAITPAATTTTYTGPGLVTVASSTSSTSVKLAANVSAVTGLGCVGQLDFTWQQADGALNSDTSVVFSAIGLSSKYKDVSLTPGLWTIKTTFTPTNLDCIVSSDESYVTVAEPGAAASGGGWYTSSGRSYFGFVVQAVSKTSPVAYKGQVVWRLGSKWRYKGTLTSYVKSPTGGASTGTGTLSYWDGSSWIVAKASVVNVTVTFQPTASATTKKTGTPGKISFKFDYTPTAAEILATGGSNTNGGLPDGSFYDLKGGTIKTS